MVGHLIVMTFVFFWIPLTSQLSCDESHACVCVVCGLWFVVLDSGSGLWIVVNFSVVCFLWFAVCGLCSRLVCVRHP